MNQWHRLLHSMIIVGLMLATWLGLAVIWFGLAVEVFEDQVTPHQPLLMTLTIVAALLTLGAGISAIALKARWPWLISGAFTVVALYGFLAYDASPPPPIDLGIRLENDDPTYQKIMWLSDNASSSRLKETNPADWADKELILPEKTEDWSDFLKQHETKIMKTWQADHLGREWIIQLSSAVPRGIWRNKFNRPTLNFKPVRYTYYIHLAHALILAQSGKRDEALLAIDQMLQTAQLLERTSPGLLHQMIATVLKKKCYQAADKILDMGRCSPSTCRSFCTTLTAGLAPQETFKLAFEGDKEWMHDTVLQGVWRGGKLESDFRQSRWLEVSLALGLKWLFINPNETNRQIARLTDEIHQLADANDDAAIDNYKPVWNTSSSLKNPCGRLIAQMIIPAFQKATASVWANEGRRLALLKKLADAK